MISPTYLTTEDAALLLGMTPEWVRRQCKAKNLVGTKLGRGYRIDPVDLKAFMRKYRGGDAPAARSRTKRGHRRVA